MTNCEFHKIKQKKKEIKESMIQKEIKELMIQKEKIKD